MTINTYLRAGLLMTGLVLAYPAQSVLIYDITDLGTLGVTGINASGQITGAFNINDDVPHAFITNPSGQMTDLGTLGGSASAGIGINTSGMVTGWSLVIDGEEQVEHAFITNPSGQMTDLGTLGGDSHGNGINASGQVTGVSRTINGSDHAFITNPSGQMTDLGTLGGSDSEGYAINDSGQVTGGSTTINGSHHAFITNPSGQMTDLGTLGGSGSVGYAINDSGQVAGLANVPYLLIEEMGIYTDVPHAFITDPSGQLTDLGTLPGMRRLGSVGRGINNIGQVVGESGHRGFVIHDGKMQDLNSLIPFSASGWFITDASGINDAGQIIGYGLYNGDTRAFLLSPTISPTPVTNATIMPILPNDSVKLTETSTTKCLNGTCDLSATGNYSFTLKLSKATLQTAGIDFSKLSANDTLSISLGDFSFSGALNDDRKYQLKSNKIKASWIASHIVCTKFKFDTTLEEMNCEKTKLVKDTTLSLSGDKKGLTFILSGNNAIFPEYRMTYGFGRYLLTGLCADMSTRQVSMPVDISIQLGGHAMIGKLTATCTVTRTPKNEKLPPKTKKLKATVQWL